MDIKKYKILIVDDEDSILDLLKDFFTQEGYNVETTNDPLKALKIVEEGETKIALTDIKMPVMDGIELLENIKRINGLVQVIIMTGYGSLENTVRCLEKGANDYLLKPFENMNEIKNIIDLTIDKLTRWEKVITDIYSK
jgi:DNA-binding NtrC family response regulator